VEEVRRAYPDGRILQGSAVSGASLRATLGRSPVVHFAGHAVFDEDRPERSHIVLPGVPPGGGRLDAAEIATLDLRGVRRVVLSACETARAQGGRAGGYVGLVAAFLSAGVTGVLGSVDRVDDRLTRQLMGAFHRAYRASGDPAAALRDAQLHLLRSPEPALRAPAAWASFRYAGA
jgi:CHAT domain-containing protein